MCGRHNTFQIICQSSRWHRLVRNACTLITTHVSEHIQIALDKSIWPALNHSAFICLLATAAPALWSARLVSLHTALRGRAVQAGSPEPGCPGRGPAPLPHTPLLPEPDGGEGLVGQRGPVQPPAGGHLQVRDTPLTCAAIPQCIVGLVDDQITVFPEYLIL